MVQTVIASLLLLGAPTAAPAVEDDRTFLGGTEVGALVAPAYIKNIDQVQALCTVLAPKRDEAPTDPRRGLARRAVYRVTVPAEGFRLMPTAVTVDLQYNLRTMGGRLNLAVLTGTDSTFGLTPTEAQGVTAAAEAGKLALDVVFRLEGEDADLPACFAGGFAGTYGLRIEPLSFTLVDAKHGTPWAHLRTARGAVFAQWLSPGGAAVSVKVISQGTEIDTVTLGGALATSDLRQCLVPVTTQRAASGLVSMSGTLNAKGRLEDLAVQVDALQEAGVVTCLLKTLSATQLEAQTVPVPVHVQVRVRRGEG